MQPNSADALKRVLTLAGVTGAALTLSAAVAMPALAGHGHGDDDGDQSSASSQSQSAHDDGQGQANQSSDNHAKAGDNRAKGGDNDAKGGAGKAKGGDNGQGGNSADGHNPPGNNGTVKIHQTAGDSSPHNQPHVTCSFYVSFFGFDKNQTMKISFTGVKWRTHG